MSILAVAQLRALLSSIVNHNPSTFADDLAEEIAYENNQRSAEEVLLVVIDTTEDAELVRFTIRLALSRQVGSPRENEFGFLSEAEIAFAPKPQPKVKSRKRQNR